MLRLFEFRTLSASLEAMTNLMVTGSGEVYGVRLPRKWTLRLSKGPRRYYPFVSPFELPVLNFPVTPVELPGDAEWEEEPTAIFHP